MTNREIAETAGVSVVWVKKLWAWYRHTKPVDITYLVRMARSENGLYGRRGHSGPRRVGPAEADAHVGQGRDRGGDRA